MGKVQIILTSIIIAVLLGIVGYILVDKNHKEMVIVAPTLTPKSPILFSTLTSTVTPEPLLTYTSQNLGISFNYPLNVGSWPIIPYEINNKIYFGIKVKNPQNDQYIQVFHTTKPSSSVADAINRTILPGYSQADCFVKNESSGVDIPSGFEAAKIAFPSNDAQNLVNKCPSPYTATNFIGYFLMDKNYPNTFLFLFIGQQPVAGVGDAITRSIKILK